VETLAGIWGGMTLQLTDEKAPKQPPPWPAGIDDGKAGAGKRKTFQLEDTQREELVAKRNVLQARIEKLKEEATRPADVAEAEKR